MLEPMKNMTVSDVKKCVEWKQDVTAIVNGEYYHVIEDRAVVEKAKCLSYQFAIIMQMVVEGWFDDKYTDCLDLYEGIMSYPNDTDMNEVHDFKKLLKLIAEYRGDIFASDDEVVALVILWKIVKFNF